MLVIFEPKDSYSLAKGWYYHVKKVQKKHLLSSIRNQYLNFFIGYPAVALQAMVALSVFASFFKGEEYPSWVRYSAIGVTILSALLVAIQTKGDFARAAEQHRMASSRFKVIIQDFEAILLDMREAQQKGNDESLNMVNKRLENLRERYSKIESESPQTFFPGIDSRVDGENTKVVDDFFPEKKVLKG
jgi:hypothetical protein